MFTKTSKGYYESTVLTSYAGLIHGFSTKSLGDMRRKENRAKLPIRHCDMFMVHQLHGTDVAYVTRQKQWHSVNADAMVYDPHGQSRIHSNPACLAVLTADCMPLLFYDKDHQSIAIAHAGWKGILSNIIHAVVLAMRKIGTKPSSLIVSVGPHIQSCCYNITKDRALKFLAIDEIQTGVVDFRHNTYFLNLGKASNRQLIAEGVNEKNIEVSNQCTSCMKSEFYSYRADTKETFGEMMSFIGVFH